jgi:hypothetical protein
MNPENFGDVCNPDICPPYDNMVIIAILKIILLLRKNTTIESVVFDLIHIEKLELIDFFTN